MSTSQVGLKDHFFSFASDIKLSHSLFALPFALCGVLLSDGSSFQLKTCFLILLCMFFARSFAMGANRYIDRFIDQKNPRTKDRALPSKRLSSSMSLGFILLFGALFVAASFAINFSIGFLSLPVLLILGCYSYMKRWTWLCHFYLGFCLSLSPVAASLAFSGSTNFSVLFLSAGVLFWTSGFDIIYALQDQHHDKHFQLRSIPETFGALNALWISRICFLFAVFFFWLAGEVFGAGLIYRIGVMLVALLLFFEHWLVRNLARSDKKEELYTIEGIFFKVNAWISVIFYLAVQMDKIF